MKILSKIQMKNLMEEFPDGGIVFEEYIPHIATTPIMVTDGSFGATYVSPVDGEIFDFDWNIEEYKDDSLFRVYDNNDVLQMIQVLTRGLKIELNYL